MIPSSLLIQILGENPLSTQKEIISVPKDLFIFLLHTYMMQQPFNEAQYLKTNPDVAEAVNRGAIDSGLTHFLNAGYWEEREGGSYKFSEDWYLRQNPDVAVSVRLGEIISGKKHYHLYGKSEWRCPSPELSDEYELWKAFLRPSAKKE
ncbi:hypothetical protein [Acetobacter sp. DsW_059]|uniref:hypothetical protein n=1 Tax=Acetobacter sp. DsW_059 TaxID=1670661 RepID=UPI000A3B6868|nr:hypothetical protein [Acetobacter sp. DsW_059]